MIDSIKAWVIKQVSAPMIGRLIRHGLTILVGMLAGSEIAGVADLAAFLTQHMDSLVIKLTATALGLVALLLSIRSDRKIVEEVK